MPELPEVETIRADLSKRILLKKIVLVKVNMKRIVQNDLKDFLACLKNNSFEKIDRRGKLIIIKLKSKEKYLLVHLKMTGQLIYEKKGKKLQGGHSDGVKIKFLPNTWTRVEIHFADSSVLYFNDMRTFGYMKLVNEDELEKIKSKFGYEPFDKKLTFAVFKKMVDSRKRNIKAFLLDQNFVAGMGNIYVDEVLFRAGVSPKRSMDTLKKSEIEKIFKAIKPILKKAIKARGTTFNDYVDSYGNKGGMKENLQVFARNGKKCFKCGNIISKEKIAGRGTHFCGFCQK